ncbi:hypothetical protein ACIBIZ_37750 [Nonomuraea spiralis]|uniref:hypothetical protein n=1 Tax=Nonomuraea spiralis TaxID=46182 RepID=UPI0037B13B2C
MDDVAPWGPATAVRKIRAGTDAHPDRGRDRLVGEAFHAGAAWVNSNAPDRLLANPFLPVLGLADGNHANIAPADNYIRPGHDSARASRGVRVPRSPQQMEARTGR